MADVSDAEYRFRHFRGIYSFRSKLVLHKWIFGTNNLA
ncbi:hypothetical protein pVco7_gp097 [Vibrio phage pVco-7]|uniref:Uncharacterized protein n=1 Tax=Vibrio phage pVco-5 TaxID=1965485 RepID=A0A1W6JV34_9CAUD|nr:hypothetical protein KNT61_gp097 [Vibrio phage pVco-5]ARM71085.1 hypothetical protein pVco5_097 [Vibrio phage pVco-5]